MADPRSIYGNLRKLQRLGLSLNEISRQAGVHRSILDRTLRGKRFSEPPQPVVERVAQLVAEKTRGAH